MSLFAYVLAPNLRAGLETFVQIVFIVFAVFSFITVSIYTSRHVRAGSLLTIHRAPPPVAMQPTSAWIFITSVLGLIYLQSALYAIVVLFGAAGILVESRRTKKTLGPDLLGPDRAMVTDPAMLWIPMLIARAARQQFGLNRLQPMKAVTWSLLIFGAVMLVESPLAEVSSWALDFLRLPHPEQQAVGSFRQDSNVSIIVVFIVEAVLIFPAIEELFFRGILLTFLKNYTSTWLAIVLSGGVFAFAHLNLGAVLPLWFLGIVLGAAYEHTGSLSVPIGVHACFNLATALSLLIEKGNGS